MAVVKIVKLVSFGFRFHALVDGFHRLPLWKVMSTPSFWIIIDTLNVSLFFKNSENLRDCAAVSLEHPSDFVSIRWFQPASETVNDESFHKVNEFASVKTVHLVNNPAVVRSRPLEDSVVSRRSVPGAGFSSQITIDSGVSSPRPPDIPSRGL